MESRINTALEKKKNGYNCCQAIVCAYADVLGINEKDLFKLTEGMGLGVSRLKQTCGAVTGMIMVAGFMNSTGNLVTPNSKNSTYNLGNDLAEKFKEQNKTTLCEVLLTTGIRSCNGFIMDACIILENNLFSAKIKKDPIHAI